MARLIGAIIETWKQTRPKKPKRGVKRVICSVIRIFICVYVGFAGILFVFQSRFVYFPNRDHAGTPEDMNLSYENVFFSSPDGVKLHGWFVPAQDSRAAVLFCHGNAGNISHRLHTVHTLNGLGWDVFIFDYRGYGHSEGKPTETGTYLDSEAAWEYLLAERRIPPERIIVMGRSLGGAIASRLARDRSPGVLILEASLTSVPDIGAEVFPFLPVRVLSRFHYNTLEHLCEANCPVLIVHSRDDELVPFSHGRRLFEAAGEPKRFLEITGSHNDGTFMSSEEYLQTLRGFVSKHLGGSSTTR